MLNCTADGERPKFHEEIESLFMAASKEDIHASWVPARVLAVVALLVTASCLRPMGKFVRAKALLASAMDHLQASACEKRVDLKVDISRCP